METKLWQDIVNFVNKNTCNQNLFSPAIALTRKTSLEDDLGITGDDGVDFLEEFHERFPFDIGDFGTLGYYFRGEGFSLFAFLFKKEKRLPLTLGMLERAVIDGVWDSKKLDEYCKL
ncbi:MAG: DUF1493 family protein [Sulfurovum sp.]|nr:MAG: DUF1493 family protein [Sulfurovum sp.]